jgi:hypothetical protein
MAVRINLNFTVLKKVTPKTVQEALSDLTYKSNRFASLKINFVCEEKSTGSNLYSATTYHPEDLVELGRLIQKLDNE